MLTEVIICEDCVHFKPFHCDIWDRCVGTHDYCSNGRPKNINADDWKAKTLKESVDRVRKEFNDCEQSYLQSAT